MTDTKLESLRDWLVTTLAELEEMGVDDPPKACRYCFREESVCLTDPCNGRKRQPRRAANGRFIKNEVR